MRAERLGAAIDDVAAADSFEKNSEADKVIILITDGEDHVGDPLKMAQKLKTENIRLYSIGVGTPEGELIPAQGGGYVKDKQGRVVKSIINETLLEQLARETGGFYVRSAPGDFGLDRIYKLGISGLQRDEQETRLAKVYEERFGWLAATALLFLMAEGLLRAPKAVLLLLLFWAPHVQAAEEKNSAVDNYNLGCELYRANDFQGSEKLFGDVASRTDDEKLKFKALYNRGTTLLAGTTSGQTTNRLEAVAEAIHLFEQSLELNPNDLDSKQNLERALNIMVSGRIKQATQLINEADSLLEQFQAKAAKENYETVKKTLDPVLEDFAPSHKEVQPLIDRADGQLQMLERAVEQTKEEIKNAKHAIDLFDYQAAADVMLADKPERRWAFDLDPELAQEFQQLIQNNQNVINIVYPQNPLKP
ncbi:MAG: VWA domain-containing protein [Kiritimatiellaeota bacterium]|nr:VWA domain-containing protein [Kiritimatiellota bacterium]